MQTAVIVLTFISVALIIFAGHLVFYKIPHLEKVISINKITMQYDAQYNSNLLEMYKDLDIKNKDLVKKIKEVHRENSRLQEELKWYAVRMDIKRKHK